MSSCLSSGVMLKGIYCYIYTLRMLRRVLTPRISVVGGREVKVSNAEKNSFRGNWKKV